MSLGYGKANCIFEELYKTNFDCFAKQFLSSFFMEYSKNRAKLNKLFT